jgi:hypothetical protein
MSTRQFLIAIADLLLKSDEGTKDWLKVRSLRRSWYVLCAISLVLFTLQVVAKPLAPILSSSANSTLALRVIQLILFICLQVSVFNLALRYYNFALTKKATIKLGNVLKLYSISTLIFGFIYQSVYIIDHGSFIYHDPAFRIAQTLGTQTFFETWKMKIDFLLFSGFQTVNSSFYKIQAHSPWVSVITYLQGLSTLGLVALFIASYVNQRTNRQESQA